MNEISKTVPFGVLMEEITNEMTEGQEGIMTCEEVEHALNKTIPQLQQSLERPLDWVAQVLAVEDDIAGRHRKFCSSTEKHGPKYFDILETSRQQLLVQPELATV